MTECTNCSEEFEKYQWNQKRCYACLEKLNPKFKTRPRKECPQCLEEFQPRTIRQTYCDDNCGHKGYMEAYYLRNYGLSKTAYEELFERHNHRCAICKEEGFKMNNRQKTPLCVDHDHSTGRVRGLLCNNCNRALGLLQDNIQNLETAIKYLQGSETIREE